MLKEFWESLVATARKSVDGDAVIALAAVGGRKYFKRADGSLLELSRRKKTVRIVSDPTGFIIAYKNFAKQQGSFEAITFVGTAAVVARDASDPETSVINHVAAYLTTERNEWVSNSNATHGSHREVMLLLRPSDSWNALLKVLSGSFTQKEILAMRAQFQAWLSKEDVPIWLKFWRNLKASTTIVEGMSGEGGLVLDETNTRRHEVRSQVFTPLTQVSEDTPQNISPDNKDFFEPFDISCKLFDWSESRTTLSVIVDIDPANPKAYRLRPIGNAIAEAELSARAELRKTLADGLQTEVVLGSGEEFSTTDL